MTDATHSNHPTAPTAPAAPTSPRRLRVLFCWAHISGYMASCWRRMARDPNVDLHVVALAPGKSANIAFNDSIMAGIPHTLVPDEELSGNPKIREAALAHKPDVIVLCGWHIPEYTSLAGDPAFSHVKFIMGMDTPRNDSLRQRLGKFARRSYFARLDHVFCTGERSWQLARLLGFPEEKISRGVYGIDYAHFEPLCEQRASQPGGWPRRFLFIGRYSEVKAIDILAAAYKKYRAMSSNPWPLMLMGSGPMADMISAVEGVENLGFVQPKDQPAQLLRAGAFVLASRFDPWPLVIVEACAAGLPVLASNACGSAVELVRPYFNGRMVATENPDSMTRAMLWLDRASAQDPNLLAEMGRRSRAMAAAYSFDMWHARWVGVMRELTGIEA